MLFLIFVFTVFKCTVNVLTPQGALYVLSCVAYAVSLAFFCFSVIKESKEKFNSTALLTFLTAEAVFLLTGTDTDNFRIPLAFSLYFIAMWQTHKNRTALSAILLTATVVLSPASIMMLPATAFFALSKNNSDRNSGILTASVCAILAAVSVIADRLTAFSTVHESIFGDFGRGLVQISAEAIIETLKYVLTVLPIFICIFIFFIILLKSNRSIVGKAAFTACIAVSAVMLFFVRFEGYPTLTGSWILSASLFYIENEKDCSQSASGFFAFCKKNMLLTVCAAVWCILFYLLLSDSPEGFLLTEMTDYFSVNP